MHYPLRHGSLFNIVTVFRTPSFEQRVDAATYRAEVSETYAKAHPVMKALIDITALDWRGRIADRDPIRHWHKGRVTVLGDAAHAAAAVAGAGRLHGDRGRSLSCRTDRAFTGTISMPRSPRLETLRAAAHGAHRFESRFMWGMFHPTAQTRAKIHARFRAMSRDDVWNALAWIYDGIALPSA